MHNPTEPKITKWPFFLGDVLLLSAAWLMCLQGPRPLALWEMPLAILCVAGGAVLGVAPFLLERRARLKLAEASALTTVVGQIRNLEAIAAQISAATGHWQNAQEQADK